MPQVEATPPEELIFSWLKNGRALRSSERMVITQTDPDISPGTTNLDIIDLKFTDFGTYTCVAALKGGGIPEISIDVNISSTTGEPHPPLSQGLISTPPSSHVAHSHTLISHAVTILMNERGHFTLQDVDLVSSNKIIYAVFVHLETKYTTF